ncbi:15461_t:CDS:2, partial [Cetraspora pellucida]
PLMFPMASYTNESSQISRSSSSSMILAPSTESESDTEEEVCFTFNEGIEQLRKDLMKNEQTFTATEYIIPIFEPKFSNITAIFAFDNSTNHSTYAKDALIALRMNLGPSRNQPVMWLTTYNDANRNQQFQSMAFEEDYEDPAMQEKPKEIKLILQKREL